MLSSRQRAGLTGMIRVGLKSGGIWASLASESCRPGVKHKVVLVCMYDVCYNVQPSSSSGKLHNDTILFDRQGVHCLEVSFQSDMKNL